MDEPVPVFMFKIVLEYKQFLVLTFISQYNIIDFGRERAAVESEKT